MTIMIIIRTIGMCVCGILGGWVAHMAYEVKYRPKH